LKDWSDLINLLRKNNYKTIETELEKYPEMINLKDMYSQTLIMLAVLFGALECIQVLIKKGADIHAKTKYGETALILAADCKQLAIANYLLEQASVVSHRDEGGQSAFEVAMKISPRENKNWFKLFDLYKQQFDDQDLELYYQHRLQNLLATAD
jgi:ankyrin repeat protein